ncbi:MAG: Catabolite activator [Nocardioides sp.]|uniref:Crp/Fnr family transcriptional regulator n=1 Tax=Nocardioides sp. TaxID=35761 RepID=UPI002614C9DF|nr:Crp/Fnr family transcriptional regulator [Nocardioides sp.]MCW2833438.1 Catabolite activator [Nocardioides sp.]
MALPNLIPSSLALSERARVVELRRRQVICREGDLSNGLFLVELGMAKVMRSAPTGAQLVLGILGPGEVIGELSLIDGGACSASAEALTPVRLRSIPSEVLMEQYEQRHEVRAWLLNVLARRLRHANTVSTDLVFTGVAERVARVVLDLAQRFGEQRLGSISVSHGLTQSELAQLVGTTRESANRALARFARHGWISLRAGSLLVHDVPALHRTAGTRKKVWR